jgi:succinate dehydrogenase/fumarate reductase flavoprotein subunit
MNQIERERRWIYSFFKPKQKGKKYPLKIKKKLQRIMWENVGLIRNKSCLEKALSEIEQMKKGLQGKICLTSMDLEYNYEWVEIIELRNLLDVANIITKSALHRTESRGAHFREDYPQRGDKNWLKNILIRKNLVKKMPSRELNIK